MNPNVFFAAALLVGAAIFLWQYSRSTAAAANSPRQAMPTVRWFTVLDRYLKITSFTIPLATLYSHSDWMLLWHNDLTLRCMGLAVAGLGGALLLWSLRTLSDQFAPCDQARAPNRLVTEGPYRWVRHPVYSANLLALAGLAVMSGSLWLLVNLALLRFAYEAIARQEESQLAAQLSGYSEFATSRGRFFPRLW